MRRATENLTPKSAQKISLASRKGMPKPEFLEHTFQAQKHATKHIFNPPPPVKI